MKRKKIVKTTIRFVPLLAYQDMVTQEERYKNRCSENFDVEKDEEHQCERKDNKQMSPDESGKKKEHG